MPCSGSTWSWGQRGVVVALAQQLWGPSPRASLQTWWFGAWQELSGVTHPLQRVYPFPQPRVHFPQFFVVVFLFFQLLFTMIYLVSSSVLVFLFWLVQVQILVLFPCFCVTMYLMVSSLRLFWVTSGFCHPRVYNLPGPLGCMLFPVSFWVFFHNKTWNFFSMCF